MKRAALLLLILILGTAMLGAQEAKTGSVGLMFTDSFAFAGIYGELFLGNLGLGATLTALPWGSGDTMVILYEPGFYGRFYMGDIASAMYLMGGMTYLTAAGSSGSGSIEGIDAGVININGGIGYNAFMGNDNATRFSLEIGPRYSAWLADGDDVFYEGFFLHFALYFGATF